MPYCAVLSCGTWRSWDCLRRLWNLKFQVLLIDVFYIRVFAILEITTLQRLSIRWSSMAFSKRPPGTPPGPLSSIRGILGRKGALLGLLLCSIPGIHQVFVCLYVSLWLGVL